MTTCLTTQLERQIVDAFAELAENSLADTGSMMSFLDANDVAYRLTGDDIDDREQLEKLTRCTLIQQVIAVTKRIERDAVERMGVII